MTEPSYAEVAQEAADEITRDANKAGTKVGDKLEKDANNASRDAEKAAQDLKSQAKDAAHKAGATAKKLQGDLKKAEKDASDKIKKEYNEKKGPVIEFFKAIAEKVSATASYVVNTTTKGAHKATEELQNPVVATQAVVAVGAITGLVIGIQERAKIFRYKSDCEITAILAGLVGLVVLDGVLFTKYYPKYDKKSLK
ncbi:unnamed protein product [Cyberlindnera jadinii]|uniref:Mitochondrial outer membrane protein OM14 C-terminal domain-containing protein n=1 Tax=Cyberlindnera jadinii (strain ATCC 18201 / CBS 1600 / BCRC 20928 / JCM 3617 / NBRC 0987 / NRRL Y-1542) TaxID=983966 RepID=A0A0H5CAK0_CYBJN|nr:hypothetical protein CYBJADRAFT_7089 [Cyberlindnera jadinii NRRL Y-1542]ODV76095.1 hypothetical protein CYBJADRAFT_7089 [Cyberlindnera jadinii NRRL Y-1542]CEP20779.1 unnamed protein product [Cyberlindnera jadinii]